MSKPWTTLVACILCGIANSPGALAGNTIIGVNVVSPDTLNDQQQDALLERLVQAGVRTIRTGLVNNKYVRFITRAFKRGISTIAIVYPTQGAPGAHMRPADPSLGIEWRVANLSDAYPEGFGRWLGPILADFIAFLRQNGLDKLADGHGVHVYPSDDPRMSQAERFVPLDKDVFAGCRQNTKPCWLTEWGFTNNNLSCPPNDQARTALVGTERKAFKHFADQGRLAAAIYYSWTGIPGTQSGFSIFRCGAITAAGKLALSPL